MKPYLEALLLSILSVFVPIKAAMITVAILIVCDLFVGIWAAAKRGEKITSSGLRRTLSKIIIYELGLAIGFLLETYLLDNILPVSKIIGGMIGIIEFKSISENLDAISGEPLFKSIAAKIGSANQVEDKLKD